MKKRIISALIALAVVIPLIIIGGIPYKIGVCLIGLIGFYELTRIKKDVPLIVKVLSYFCFILILTYNITNDNITMNINSLYILMPILMLLLPIVLYHDNETYNYEDASFLITSVLFLGLGFNILMQIREYNVYYLIFLLLITFLSDTYAYITGNLIGKNKLCESLSPNKSVEGFIGGLTVTTAICTVLYINAFSYKGNILVLVIIIMGLSLISTMGDLLFSSIKRKYKIKDFGNIMPGHGGVLDRLDSLLFVLLTFYFIISFM